MNEGHPPNTAQSELEWPPGFEPLQESERQRLATLIQKAQERERESLRRALEQALKYLPSLLRGPVRRILFPDGRR